MVERDIEARPSDYVVTLGRSAFAAVPWIGGALNEIAFDHRSRLKRHRFKAFLHIEEFSDLFEAVL